MLEITRCPGCGGVLPSGSPGGLCPQCAERDVRPSQSEPDPARAPTLPQPPQSTGGFVAPTPEELAARFPQLEILALIGQGGMGAVYKARQPKLDRLVAVKILPRDFEANAAFAQRFTREARALAKLNHPNIVSIYDFGEIEGLFYFVMEYVDGVNLRQMIAGGGLAPKDALAIVPKICDALQFAHDEGIVHRDIKPANILVDTRGRVKIADFGLVKLLGHDLSEQMLTAAHQVMGTLRYMAPEQMQGSREVDHRADIYSLGVVFYEILTGELPIGRFAPPSQKAAVDVRLDEVVLRSLEAEPERRYQHASDVKTDVEIIGQNPGTMPLVRGGEAPVRPEIPVIPAAGLESQDAARQYVRGPAIGLIVAGVVNIVPSTLAVLDIRNGVSFAPVVIVAFLLGIPFGVASIIGGVSMRRLQLYPLVIGAIVTAMLPLTPACLISLPCGIWALAVILNADVRAAFGRNAQNRRLPSTGAAATPIERSIPQDRSESPVLSDPLLAGIPAPAPNPSSGNKSRSAESSRMHIFWYVLIFLLLAVPAYYWLSKPERESSRGQGTPSTEGLASRLAAAKGIDDVAEKDKALARLAQDAGDAGDARIADQALTAMNDVGVKDEAAYSAALRLAKTGKVDAAAATANAISEVSLKDKALAKIAKGDSSE